MPLTVAGRLDARGFEDRRHDVDDVMELGADATDVLDVAGPRNGHALPGPAEMRRHLLGPLERRIERPRPRHRHMRVGLVGAPVFVMQHLLGFREVQNAVVGGHLVRSALQGAFGAGAVVAADVDDQRVVELAHVLDRLDDAADLMVGIGGVGGKDLRLARVEFLLDRRRASPTSAGSSGQGVSWVFAGITPSRFWLAKICSRSFSQPMSNLPLNLSIHSFFGWCGECVPPGT